MRQFAGQKLKVKSLKSKAISHRPQIKKIFSLFIVFCFLVSIMGCDAFVRKFTRKPKKENLPQEEMVLAPQVYQGQQMSKEELYRQYLLYWKSWHDELMQSLLDKRSLKKQLDCVEEELKNLVSLRELLNENKKKQLDVYIQRIMDIKDEINRDIYGNNSLNNFHSVERIRRDILRDFSYNKIKHDLT